MSKLCKDSISPKTVGYILQAIADLLATATNGHLTTQSVKELDIFL